MKKRTTNAPLKSLSRKKLSTAGDYAEGIIETMRGPLLVLDPELRIRFANRAFYKFFQLTKAQTEGKSIYDLANREWNIPALRDRIRNVFPKELDFKDFPIEHDFPGIGKRMMIVNAHRLPVDGHGTDALIFLSFEDITGYKVAEQSLRETQEQLKLALGAGSVGTWSWDIKTNEVKSSAEEQKLYGLAEGGSWKTYAEWEKAIHPFDVDRIRAAMQQSIKERKPVDIEFRIVWPNGTTHWMLAKANTYYDADGAPEKMVGVHIDITERKSALEALAESEKRFHTMSDNAPVMIWMAGPDRQTNFLNRTWLSFTGKTLAQESGEGWFTGIHPEDKKTFVDVYERAFALKEGFKIDFRLRRHDGEYRWLMTHGVPRFRGDNRFVGFIGTCVDITDRIDLERQKDDFMGIASHELKTPVTSIKAYTQILQDRFIKANDTVSANMLGRLDLQIDKLTALINSLLDVAKVQSGQMDYFDEHFDIHSFIHEVTEEIQRACPSHNIVTEVNTYGKVYGDKARLAQVLNNLISNAVKYSPEGKEVAVHADRRDNEYVFMVEDFGVGISMDMQEKVFGRFFRVSEASGNRVSGLGLGLYISSQIVKQQGGKFWVESQPGEGSRFYFSLPVKDE